MGCEEYENYYLKAEELEFILAGIGQSDWYGIISENRADCYNQISKEKIYQIVTELYQKSYIEWRGKSICFLEPINSLAKIMKNAGLCIQFELQIPEKYKGICYFDEESIVWLEQSHTENDMFRFSLWKEQEFLCYLWDKNIFPEDEMEDESNQCTDAQEVIKCILSLRDIETGLEIEKMMLSELGIFSYVTIWNKNGITKTFYQKERCESLLKQWLHKKGDREI